MLNRLDDYFKKHPYLRRTIEALMVLFMALYPLRHIHVGLDLWDTGYNYANFEYMGLDSMDSMWFFSTYLANGLGHLMSILPFGKTVLGLNFYTALMISLLAIMAYMFCTRIIKLPKSISFVGEYMAISLCWCPTALLYNYMTYLFLMITVICLYFGLHKKRKHCLYFAGVFLGLNVFVRFSNLPEVVLIFAVWVYGILETEAKAKTETGTLRKRERKNGFNRSLIRTLMCIGGYATSVGGMLLFFGIQYGFGAYFKAITRLFAMTDEASDYSAMSMIRGLINWYKEAGYWFSRLCVFAIGGILVCALAKHLDIQYGRKEHTGGLFGKNFNFLGWAYVISGVFALGAIYWLYRKDFSFGHYGEYGQILLPCAVLILVSVIACIIQIFKPGNTLETRLINGLVLIVILITPIGSNTGIFPVINNQFLIAPILLYSLWTMLSVRDGEGISRYNFNNPLIVRENNKRRKNYEVALSYVSLFPVKAVICVFYALCIVQITLFGHAFVFTEANNAWDTYYTVSVDSTVKGIRMNYDKASNYAELYGYIQSEGLQENELITYGNIPALSFYLQMPAAFNPWIDLDSYNEAILAQDLEKTVNEAEEAISQSAAATITGIPNVIKDNINDEADEDATESLLSRKNAYPVVIIDAKYVDYIDLDNAEKIVQDESLDESIRKEASEILDNGKWKLLTGYFEQAGYEITFVNRKYAVLVAADVTAEE